MRFELDEQLYSKDLNSAPSLARRPPEPYYTFLSQDNLFVLSKATVIVLQLDVCDLVPSPWRSFETKSSPPSLLGYKTPFVSLLENPNYTSNPRRKE
jgi:hypothetical protein